jgi:CHASE2 domain-containing sensor protein
MLKMTRPRQIVLDMLRNPPEDEGLKGRRNNLAAHLQVTPTGNGNA